MPFIIFWFGCCCVLAGTFSSLLGIKVVDAFAIRRHSIRWATTPSYRHVNSHRCERLCRSAARSDNEDDENTKPRHVDYDVVIVGGGLVGCATAVALQRHGVTVRIYEQSTRLARVGAAIGLYPNGLTALACVCPTLYATVQRDAIASRYFERRNLQDELVQRTDVQQIQAVSPVYYPWYMLQQGFLQALSSQTPGTDNNNNTVVQWGHQFQSFVIQTDGTVVATFCSSSPPQLDNHSPYSNTTVTCRVLLGADGIYSAVRQQVLSTPPVLRTYDKVMYRAVLPIMAENNRLTCPPTGTQISYQGDDPGQSFSFRETLPGIMTVTAAVLVDEETNQDTHSQQTTASSRKVRLQSHFCNYPRPVQQIMQALDAENIHESRIRDMEHIPETWSNGPVVLIGDAAHAMTPYMGQGANMGLEDVCVLVHALVPVLMAANTTKNNSNTEDVSAALLEYCRQRRPRVVAVHAQSRQNALQSTTFDQHSAGTPFQRRAYTEHFKKDLYEWKPPGVDEKKQN